MKTELRLAAKAGIALFPGDGVDADTLFRNAEAALKNAKISGERYLFYATEMNARAAQVLSLEMRLRKAVEAQQFVLHYQPKVEFSTGCIVGLEALIRWNDPETGLVPPVQFIPLLKCDEMQGYLFSKPLPSAQLIDLLRERAPGPPPSGSRSASLR